MKTIENEIFHFCTYCLTPLKHGQVKCYTCGGELVNDPGVELTEREYRQQPRKACAHCGKPVIIFASICYACRKPVNEN